MSYYFLFIIIFIIIILAVILTRHHDTFDTHTTFLGSNGNYAILIVGALNKAHVQEAEESIGTINKVRIGNLVTSIGVNEDSTSTAPFYEKTNLRSLIFKKESICTIIGSYCFYGCTGLTKLNLPNSMLTIFGYAFNSCINLTSVSFGNSLTKFSGQYSFQNCTGLTSIIFPASLLVVGYGAFLGINLTSVTFLGSGVSKLVTTGTLFTGVNPFSAPASAVTAAGGIQITIPPEGITYT